MPAVVGLELKHVPVVVGDERVVVPGEEQRQLRPGCRSYLAHPQPDLTGVPSVDVEEGAGRLRDVDVGDLGG